MFPDDRMTYIGLKDRQQKAHLIAYLMTDET
jgi:cytochrome c2